MLAFYEQQHGNEKLELAERAPLAPPKDKDDVDSIKKMSNGISMEVPARNQDRRPSKLITVPSCISLHSEIYDLTYDKEDEK